MINSNKITNTKIGDDIHFYINGIEDRGIVVKMSNEYVRVFKESTQDFDDIHINDTFFIKDILINKEWDKMDDQERWEALDKIHAPTPRFIMKSWNDLPKEIKVLLTKNNAIETSHGEGDDDDMNVTARIFDKGEGGTGRKIGEDQTAGKDTGEQPKAGETERIDAGDKTQGKKHRKQEIRTNPETTPDKHGVGERGVATEETPDHTRASESIQLLSQQVSQDPDIAASDKIQEGQMGRAAQHQQDLHEAKQTKEGVDRKVAERKERKENISTKVPKKVTEGVSALKAWQLWLAKRELRPETYQDAKGRKLGMSRSAQAERGGQTSSGQSTQARLSPDDEPMSRERVKDPVLGNPTKKSFYEQWLDNKKTNSERSIHGNAAREPNSGVNTNIGFDAPKDYEGFTHSGVRPEQFKHERKKPKATTKERVNIGETYPSKAGQGTGDGGNPYDTVTHNKDTKGRAEQGEDRN